MLELALSASVLVPCLAGSFQFGYGLYTYNRLQSAVDNGGRYASIRTYRGLNGVTDQTKMKLAIQNVAVYGTPSPANGAVPIVPGLTSDKVNVSWTYTSGVPTAVSINITSYTINTIFTSYAIAGKPIVNFPYLGRYAPKETEP